MVKIESVADIFDAIGGSSAVARELKVGVSTASEMKRRGRIPVEYWQELIASAHRRHLKNVDADTLVRIHSRNGDKGAPKAEHGETSGSGQFTRFRHVRRSRFQTLDEINDHVRALREEWDRR